MQQIEYNQWFQTMVQKYKPEWSKYIKTKYSAEFDVQYLDLEIPPMFINSKQILIENLKCELTIFFGSFHYHADMFENCDHEDEFKKAVEFIEMLINEVIVFIKDETQSIDSCQHIEEEIKIGTGVKANVYSYKGTYDKVFLPK